MSNVEKLQSAGLLPAEHGLTTDDVNVLNALSKDEVAMMVRLRIEPTRSHHGAAARVSL
jgi:hypothetical protein